MKRLLLLSEEIEATKKEKENIEANVNKVKGELSEAKHSLITTRQRLQEVYDETHRYKEELSTNERLLEEKIEENKRIVSLINRTKLQEQSSEIIDNIKKAAVGRHVMSELEWKRLYKAVDEIRPDLMEKMVHHLDHFTEQQKQTCYLISIGLTNGQIENLTNIPHTTVWRLVKQLSWVNEDDAL